MFLEKIMPWKKICFSEKIFKNVCFLECYGIKDDDDDDENINKYIQINNRAN